MTHALLLPSLDDLGHRDGTLGHFELAPFPSKGEDGVTDYAREDEPVEGRSCQFHAFKRTRKMGGKRGKIKYRISRIA